MKTCNYEMISQYRMLEDKRYTVYIKKWPTESVLPNRDVLLGIKTSLFKSSPISFAFWL